jgi:NAD(P)-dependent dehydrogenase (short-subunit alcohol dehydrogenase family)
MNGERRGAGLVRLPAGRRLEVHEKLEQAVLGHTALERWGRPGDLVGTYHFLASAASEFVTGGAYSYLASDASRWTTGSAIVADGGYAAP